MAILHISVNLKENNRIIQAQPHRDEFNKQQKRKQGRKGERKMKTPGTSSKEELMRHI